MICRNCRATVDDDLVFCTNCGARLYEPNEADAPTIAMRDSAATQAAAPKKSSPVKWIALIVALVALPASLGLAYLLSKNSMPTVANTKKSAPVNRKTPMNSANKNVNAATTNANANASSNGNRENNSTNDNGQNFNLGEPQSTVIFDEQIEIAPNSNIAYPFALDGEAKIVGKIQTVRGEAVQGYVFTQSSYDEHFPNATYKTFSFDGKNPEIEQLLVKDDYVLVFLNESKSALIIKGKVEVSPTNAVENQKR